MTICFIIVAGVGITFSTSRLTNQNAKSAARQVYEEAALAAETAADSAMDGGAAAENASEVPPERRSLPSGEAGAAAGNTEGAAAPSEENREAPFLEASPEEAPIPESSVPKETAAEDSVMISPLTGGQIADGGADGSDPAEKGGGIDYASRLSEIDSQIQKMRSEEKASSTYSVKNAAEYEFNLWDTTLNEIYEAILSQMGEEQKEALKQEELDWMKERDAAAKEAANKYNGGVLEGVEYTASMASSTRERAYHLVEEYGQYLGNSD